MVPPFWQKIFLIKNSMKFNSIGLEKKSQAQWLTLNPPSINASGGQEPFCKKVPGPPKTFYLKSWVS
jgi:hypothetical protein